MAVRREIAKITGGYDLPAKYVIHTVGPVWRGGGQGEPGLLASCYRRCFEIVDDKGITSIAFPAISAGVYGYPLEQATRIAVTETNNHLERESPLAKVTFACFRCGGEGCVYGSGRRHRCGLTIT